MGASWQLPLSNSSERIFIHRKLSTVFCHNLVITHPGILFFGTDTKQIEFNTLQRFTRPSTCRKTHRIN